MLPDEARSALPKVLASPSFARAPSMQRLLTYLVDASANGHEELLKPGAIGREALGRGTRFDPAVDPVVRVECARLRRMLEAYYAAEGKTDPYVIELPRGAYVIRLRPNPDNAPQSMPEISSTRPVPQVTAATRWRAVPVLSVLAVVVLVVGLAGNWAGLPPANELTDIVQPAVPRPQVRAGSPSSNPPERRTRYPVLVVQPFDATDGDAAAQDAARRMTSRLRNALVHFELLVMLDGDQQPRDPSVVGSVKVGSPIPETLPDAAFSPTYRIAGSFVREPDGDLAFTGRIVDSAGRIVSARTYENGPPTIGVELTRWIDQIARSSATRIGSSFGVVVNAELRRRNGVWDVREDSYACILATLESWRQPTSPLNQATSECLASALSRDPLNPQILSVSAESEVLAWRHGISFLGEKASIDRALERARRASELAPNSALAVAAQFSALRFASDPSEAIAAGRKALRLNPLEAYIMVELGGFLIKQGDVDNGLVLLNDDSLAHLALPPWIAGARALSALMHDDMEQVRVEAGRTRQSILFLNILMRYVAARAHDDKETANAAWGQFDNEFLKNPTESLRKRGFGDRVSAKLLPYLSAP